MSKTTGGIGENCAQHEQKPCAEFLKFLCRIPRALG